MATSQSVYSGEIQWWQRSESNPRYRPFGAFAGCQPMALPRQLTKEEEEYQANEERMERELAELMARRVTPPKEEEPAKQPSKVRQEPHLAVFWRETRLQLRETRDQIRAPYKRAAFAVDGCLYWAGRWYREKSIFPELFYVLRCVAKTVVVLALVAWLVKTRVDAWREKPVPFVYTQVPQYQMWSVSKPRCDCDAE